MTDNIIRLDYRQHRAVCRLVHECCNYDGGNCLLLDNGDERVCPQGISYSLICKWFRAAVLPQDSSLCAILLHRSHAKRCTICGKSFVPNSNRAKYCPDCAITARRKKEAERQRRRYYNSTHLGGKNPL